MKLKVCGLSNSEDVKICVSLKINYCGFILNYPKSHRHITFDKAKELTGIKKENTKYVGVLVHPTNAELKKFSKLNFDYFQIYGELNSEKLKKIKEKFKKKVIAAIQVKEKSDIKKYKSIESSSDIILWDSSGYEQSISWNYNWLKTISVNVEKMIGGNITIGKIQELGHLADIIDVSGALETNKVKDINKIKKFTAEFNKINNAN
jgi:phosphoribosylanthranilate isomerase